jgi:predicted HicB family RNase H-like nuclease
MNMNTSPITYKGHAPLLTPENGGWNGRIAGIQAIETFEGDTYEAAIEDFKRAVNFYLETEPNPERPFSGRITFQIAPEIHAELFRKAQEAGADNFDNWLAQELKESVLHA